MLQVRGLPSPESRGYICTFSGRKFSSNIFFLPDEPGEHPPHRGPREAGKKLCRLFLSFHIQLTSAGDAESESGQPGKTPHPRSPGQLCGSSGPYQHQPTPCLPSRTSPVSSGQLELNYTRIRSIAWTFFRH